MEKERERYKSFADQFITLCYGCFYKSFAFTENTPCTTLFGESLRVVSSAVLALDDEPVYLQFASNETIGTWAKCVTISHTRTHSLYLFILFVSRCFFLPLSRLSPFNSYIFGETLVLYSEFVLRYVFVCSSYAYIQVCCRFSFMLLFQFVCVVVFLLLFLPSLRFCFAAMSSAYLSAVFFFSGLCYSKGVAYT